MKDLLKVAALYFTSAVSTFVGIGVGLKVCDKLLDSKASTTKEGAE